MITGIREKTIVREDGRIGISSSELPVGKQVEVIILVEDEKRDATEYLLSTEANRRHLEQALEDAKDPDRLTYFDLENK